jgi:hypothetical protein
MDSSASLKLSRIVGSVGESERQETRSGAGRYETVSVTNYKDQSTLFAHAEIPLLGRSN